MQKLFFLFVFIIPNSFYCSYSQGIGNGTRIDLTSALELNTETSGQFAQLFIPDHYQLSENGKFDLVIHLHGASWATENMVYKANAILFNIHLAGLSGIYKNYFSVQIKFQKILDIVTDVLQEKKIIANPQIEHLIIRSFSAGYGGVREILKNDIYYKKIDALILADGLHCDSDSATKAFQLQDFLRFARDSRDKQKIMFISHSSVLTDGYDNTTQTANYLIRGIGSILQTHSAVDELGIQYSKCDTGYFHVKGYYGDTANDHLNHLHFMNKRLENVLEILCDDQNSLEE